MSGMLQSMGSWRVRHKLATEQQQQQQLIKNGKVMHHEELRQYKESSQSKSVWLMPEKGINGTMVESK